MENTIHQITNCSRKVEQENGSTTERRQSFGCSRILVFSVLLVGALCLLTVGSGVLLLDDTIDKGQCAAARNTPTSLPIPIGPPIDIPSRFLQLTLQPIVVSNAEHLGELGQLTYSKAPVQELWFNLDNSLSLVDNTTWIDTNWADVAVAPSGRTIVYIDRRPSESSVIRWCDVATMRQIHASDSDETANQLRFSADGRLLAVNEGRGVISIYDTATHAKQTSFDVLNGRRWVNTNQLALSPDGTLLAFAMDDYVQNEYTLRVWDIKAPRQLAILQGHTQKVLGLTFNHDGTLLASISMDGTLRLWGIP